MAKKNFKISKFQNSNGTVSWRVSGTLNGKRIRKNFKEYKQASASAQKLEIRALNETVSEGRTIFTTLSKEENQDAIAAVSLLKKAGSKRSLVFTVDYFLKHFKEAAQSKTVREATDEYYEHRQTQYQRGALSLGQVESIRFEFAKFTRYFGERILNEIHPDELSDYIESTTKGRSHQGPSLKTWNNRRGYLNTFFNFCVKKKYVAENPVADVEMFRIKNRRGTAETLTVEQAKEMMHFLETYRGEQNKNGTWPGQPGCLVPFYALNLFAGIRPDFRKGEITKLEAKDIRLDTGVILIEPEVSKVNEKRSIKIQPNLRLWLEKYPISKYPIVQMKRFDELWKWSRKQFSFLKHDTLRHTYISNLVAAFRSVGDASLQAGNSESIVRRHYLDLKTEEEADAFWNITPKGTSLPPMEKKNGRYISIQVSEI